MLLLFECKHVLVYECAHARMRVKPIGQRSTLIVLHDRSLVFSDSVSQGDLELTIP